MDSHNDTCNIKALEDDLIKLEIKLQLQYMELGKNLIETTNNKQVIIDHLIDEIINVKKKLSTNKNEVLCSNCMTYNPSNSNYCNFCGKHLNLRKDKNYE